MASKETNNYLADLENQGIILGLDRIRKFLSMLGGPEKKFRTIHIAGTNGKGSTAAMLASILQKAGFKTGLYTSPHILEFNERIQVNGEKISDSQLEKLVFSLKRTKDAASLKLTYFEFTTALAFDYFAEQNVDIAVIEVGLGGRLDATNVILPELTAITNIAIEHEKYLGSNKEEIATEKAGIVKQDIPLFTTEQDSLIFGIFESVCETKRSEFVQLNKPYAGKIPFPGKHQKMNAALAVGLARKLDIEEAIICEGIASAKWPARFERIKQEPEIIIDVAHNPAGAKALAETIVEELGGKKVLLVLGVASDKDIEGIAKHLAPVADKVFATEASFRGMPAEKVLAEVKKFNPNAVLGGPVNNAIEDALEEAVPNDAIVVCGSHFTVGEAIQFLK